MIKTAVGLLMATGLVAQVAAQDMESEEERLGYSIGYEFGAELQSYDIDIDLEAVYAAIEAAYSGNEPAVEVEEMRERMVALQERIREERMAEFEALAEQNQVRAEEFLNENESKNGIVSLPSGVQYRIIEEGEGERPTMDDVVTVHYRGSKTDGREFDSSFRRGVPAVFEVNSVIAGWQEILPLMREGAMWQVFLPPELAFGVRGDPPAIGPNEALQFDLRLVQIGAPEGFEDQQPQEGVTP